MLLVMIGLVLRDEILNLNREEERERTREEEEGDIYREMREGEYTTADNICARLFNVYLLSVHCF